MINCDQIVSFSTFQIYHFADMIRGQRGPITQYKEIPKESQIGQKTLEIVNSIALARLKPDKQQQQIANQSITQQTNYLKQHISDLRQAFVVNEKATDKTLILQQEQHEKLKLELERKERLINKFKGKMCDL